MSVLFIAQLHVTDMDALRRDYGAHLGPINARHGAEPVAFHAAADLIEGDGPAPAVAVMRFPSRAALDAWLADHDYAPLLKRRHELTDLARSSVVVLEERV